MSGTIHDDRIARLRDATSTLLDAAHRNAARVMNERAREEYRAQVKILNEVLSVLLQQADNAPNGRDRELWIQSAVLNVAHVRRTMTKLEESV